MIKITNINLISEAIPKTIEQTNKAIPETIKAIDTVFSSVINIANTLMTPFNLANLHANYALNKTKLKLDEKLKNIPPDKIVNPPSYIAVPTIQAISYSADCNELHSMFASLLATAMNNDTKDIAHPSFVEIIKQLSPLEAKLLSSQEIMNGQDIPLCCVRLQEPSRLRPFPFPKPMAPVTSGETILNRLAIFQDYEALNIHLVSSSIDNFLRLGILDFHNGFIIEKGAYSRILKYVDQLKIDLRIDELETETQYRLRNYKFALTPQAVSVSSFGKFFIKACLS
jgi:hypothetical protein